jgi:hypothetical protein
VSVSPVSGNVFVTDLNMHNVQVRESPELCTRNTESVVTCMPRTSTRTMFKCVEKPQAQRDIRPASFSCLYFGSRTGGAHLSTFSIAFCRFQAPTACFSHPWSSLIPFSNAFCRFLAPTVCFSRPLASMVDSQVSCGCRAAFA